MPVWLITGGSGFLGRHLLDLLRLSRPGAVELVTIGRRETPVDPGASHVAADLEDAANLRTVLRDFLPDAVFHLAGCTPPASADRLYRSNTLATLHLLDGLRALDRPARLVMTGSAAELGPVAVDRLPASEDEAPRPVTPYGLSKWLATTAGLLAAPPLEVVVARVFNPIGPGLPASQAIGRFARELAGGTGPLTLEVGDLDARRDFVDARDVSAALLALFRHGAAGRVYHVGTGRSQRVGDALDRLIARSGREVTVEVDPAIARDRGPADSRADIRRITDATGWAPRHGWERSLDDLWAEAVGLGQGSG